MPFYAFLDAYGLDILPAPPVLRWTLLPLPRHDFRAGFLGCRAPFINTPQDEVCEVIEGEREVTVDDVTQVVRAGLLGIVPIVREECSALPDRCRAILELIAFLSSMEGYPDHRLGRFRGLLPTLRS